MRRSRASRRRTASPWAPSAVATSNLGGTAMLGTGSSMTASGALTVSATTNATATTTASGDTSAGTASVGAAIALTFANHSAVAEADRAVTGVGGAVTITAT